MYEVLWPLELEMPGSLVGATLTVILAKLQLQDVERVYISGKLSIG